MYFGIILALTCPNVAEQKETFNWQIADYFMFYAFRVIAQMYSEIIYNNH